MRFLERRLPTPPVIRIAVELSKKRLPMTVAEEAKRLMPVSLWWMVLERICTPVLRKTCTAGSGAEMPALISFPSAGALPPTMTLVASAMMILFNVLLLITPPLPPMATAAPI
jgi:hypothetical protein